MKIDANYDRDSPALDGGLVTAVDGSSREDAVKLVLDIQPFGEYIGLMHDEDSSDGDDSGVDADAQVFFGFVVCADNTRAGGVESQQQRAEEEAVDNDDDEMEDVKEEEDEEEDEGGQEALFIDSYGAVEIVSTYASYMDIDADGGSDLSEGTVEGEGAASVGLRAALTAFLKWEKEAKTDTGAGAGAGAGVSSAVFSASSPPSVSGSGAASELSRENETAEELMLRICRNVAFCLAQLSFTRTSVCTRLRIHACAHTYTHTHRHLDTQTHRHQYKNTRIQEYTQAHVHVHTRIKHIHAPTHIHSRHSRRCQEACRALPVLQEQAGRRSDLPLLHHHRGQSSQIRKA